MQYAPAIEDVLHTISNARNMGVVYETDDEIRAVISAVDCGFCRLVENKCHPFRLHDHHWNVTLGIELTSSGLEHLAIDEQNYRRPQ